MWQTTKGTHAKSTNKSEYSTTLVHNPTGDLKTGLPVRVVLSRAGSEELSLSSVGMHSTAPLREAGKPLLGDFAATVQGRDTLDYHILHGELCPPGPTPGH